MYKKNLLKLILMGILGFVVGLSLALSTQPELEWGHIKLAAFCAGIPYGWQLSSKLIGGLVLGNIAVMFIAVMIRLVLSMIIGWVAYPIALIYAVVKLIQEQCHN